MVPCCWAVVSGREVDAPLTGDPPWLGVGLSQPALARSRCQYRVSVDLSGTLAQLRKLHRYLAFLACDLRFRVCRCWYLTESTTWVYRVRGGWGLARRVLPSLLEPAPGLVEGSDVSPHPAADVVEWLQSIKYETPNEQWRFRPVIHAATDEIEDLRFEVERLRSRLKGAEAERDELWSEGNFYRAEIERLRAGIRCAVAELDADHRPEGDPGKEPWGCVMCYPRDGDWPCVSRMIADDLRNLS